MPDDKGFKATNKLVIDWQIDKINPALAAAKAGEERALKPEYGKMPDEWNIEFILRGKDAADKHAGVYLYVRPQEPDYRNGSATRHWMREGKWDITFELFALDDHPLIRPLCLKDIVFDSESGWGSEGIASWDVLSSVHVTEKNAFRLRCTIDGQHRHQPDHRYSYGPSKPSNEVLAGLYCDRSHTDVVFCVAPVEGKPSYLPALRKIFTAKACSFYEVFDRSSASSYKTSCVTVKLTLKEIFAEPDKPYLGDVEDFAAFEEGLIAQDDDEESNGGERKVSLRGRRSRRRRSRGRYGGYDSDDDEDEVDPAIASPPQPDNDEEEDPEDQSRTGEEGDGEPCKKKQKAGKDEARSLLQITVKDCSFATLDALLYYLYSDSLSLLPPTSNYLVAYHAARDPPSPPPRDEWLENAALKNDAHLCKPHSLFRLAGRFRVYELGERVKQYLVRSLTVENAAYELFSSLSIDYPEYQKPVLSFMLENWDKVKQTLAFKQAIELLEAGDLPSGAGAVLHELFEGLSAVKKDKDEGEKRRGERDEEEY